MTGVPLAVLLFAGYALLARWRPGAWTNGLVLGFLGFLGRSRCPAGSHHLVVLGGRLDRAVDQWRADRDAGYDSLVIPSGGRGSDESRAEGDAMAAYLREHGVPAEAIRVEDRATTTAENLRFSTELVAGERPAELVVVTSSYHAVRAADLCRRQRLRARVLGAGTARYLMPSALLREYLALLAVHPWLNAIMVALIFSTGPLAWWLSSMS